MNNDTINQGNLPTTKPQNHINIQNNIVMSNELDAIGRLPKPLADRAMNLLEKTTEHKMQTDREVIEIEKKEQKNRENYMYKFYTLQSLGVLISSICILGSMGLFAYLAMQDKPNAWVLILPTLSPIIVAAFVALSNIKNHKN